MARKPEIFLRDLDPDEAHRLVKIARSTRDRVRMRRAGMALASMQGRSVPEIAVMFAAKQETVRELINTFNDRGFSALDPKARRGSMPRIGPMVREQICRTAKSDPARLGCPFTCWSLTKLRDYLAENKHIRVSHETIRQVLRKAGISFQNTKTWKHSSDPEFAAKKQRILALYDRSPADGRVICVDEFGPLNLQPRPGRGWFPTRRPARLLATYHRTAGVRPVGGCRRFVKADTRDAEAGAPRELGRSISLRDRSSSGHGSRRGCPPAARTRPRGSRGSGGSRALVAGSSIAFAAGRLGSVVVAGPAAE